ncbi:hypothetical protein BS78_03G203600 [Paspalum vaginatum]|nr:hypothetical protein BS78_03G203600 [Paspalum vaginatum]
MECWAQKDKASSTGSMYTLRTLPRFGSLAWHGRRPGRLATLHLRPPPRETDVAALDRTKEIKGVAMGALSFALENCDWSLLPAPTPPTSPTLTAEGPSTPRKASIPYVGMPFENIHAVENFYKEYARDIGFALRVGQQRMENDIVIWKRFMCNRQGFSTKEKDNAVHPPTDICSKGRSD